MEDALIPPETTAASVMLVMLSVLMGIAVLVRRKKMHTVSSLRASFFDAIGQ